jgi:hypothetical protein
VPEVPKLVKILTILIPLSIVYSQPAGIIVEKLNSRVTPDFSKTRESSGFRTESSADGLGWQEINRRAT